MAHRFARSITNRLLLWLILCFIFSISGIAFAQSTDEVALRSLAEKFFAAYQKADLDGLMLLWSEKSDDYAASKKSFQQSFATNKIEVKSLTLGRLTIDGEKASLSVVLDSSGIDVKTGKPAEGFGQLNRTLHFIKDGSVWKVSRFISREDELAVRIVEAKTEAERKALLEADKELITVALVQALRTQGIHLFTQSKYPQALAIYELTGEIANQLGYKKGIINVLLGLGVIHRNQGNYTQALEYFHRSLKLAEEINDKSAISSALINLGNVSQDQGNYPQALEYQQRSLKLAEEIDDKERIVHALGNIGTLLQDHGNYTQALEYLHRCLKIAEEIGAKDGVAYTLGNIGNVLQSQGNYAQALEYLHRSLKLTEEIGNQRGIGISLNNIGTVLQSQGNYTQAFNYYDKSLKIAEEIGDKDGVAYTLGNIGVLLQIQGNYTQALNYYDKSLKIAEELGNQHGISVSFNSIGIVHQLQGNYPQALEYQQKSLKLAEEINDKVAISTALTYTAMVHQLQGNYKQAVELANRASDIAQQLGSPSLIWTARIIEGQSYQALNLIEQAKQAFTTAIAAIEETRNQVVGTEQQQQQFFAEKLDPYYGMVSLLLAENNSTDALAFAERAKARTLLDVLQTGKLNITKAMGLAEKQEEQQLNSQLVSLNAQIYQENLSAQPDQNRLNDLNVRLQKIRLEMEVFQTSLYAAHPELKVQRGQAQPLTLADAATLLPDDKTALLEFVVTNDQTYLFVITKSSAPSTTADLKVYNIDIKQQELAKLCQEFRQQLADRRIAYRDLAAKFYDRLLRPARASLLGKSNLVIIPDGVLWELPFQALQPARNHFLIEDCAISYAPSLTVLHKMVTRRQTRSAKATTPLLAIGNPIVAPETSMRVKVLMSEKLLPLPEAEHQVKLLGQLYGASQSKIYVRQAASEERVKAEAEGSRILHLATHSILNDASPMYSQIVLARSPGDTNEDGLLEAWEIMNMDLKADLVVLSACETARGKLGAGEGMIGLSWALFVAGSPATVVSQWKVESASTTELMVEFHKHLYGQNHDQQLTKTEAMRRAALKLLKMKNYRHPFYWAAFVIIGDAN